MVLFFASQCLHEFVSKDPYKEIKERENQVALQQLTKRLAFVDALSPKDRVRELVNGVLAGNMFDWGAKDVADMMIKGELNFQSAGEKINRPGLIDNYEEFESRIIEGVPYNKAFIFLDNSGADTILGVIPFARELLKALARFHEVKILREFQSILLSFFFFSSG